MARLGEQPGRPVTIERLLEAGRALEAGDLRRADQIYRQVAQTDPRSSIAVVGLARVALGRGAVAEAVDLARSALAIDPANAAARRLIEEQAHDRPGSRPAAPAAQGAAEIGNQPPNPDKEWPWPDLDDQLERYRDPGPGLLTRLLRRGRR